MMSAVLAVRESFTVYDEAYVMLAQALESPLITADAKLLEAQEIGVEVRVLRPPQEAITGTTPGWPSRTVPTA